MADRGPAFEVRRCVRAAQDVFGRDQPHAADAGALFLDTETTGLAGGTGTTPFLIGLATVDDGVVICEQYFLRRLSGEPAMLEALRRLLSGAQTLVTFNGRRFDWPILEARFVMSRIPLDPPAEHADLIGVGRRLWYRALGTYRLTAIERHVLGIERADDIDAARIPGLYLDYLRTGDPQPLQPVFAHNLQDVLCLLHLRHRARRWISGGEDPPAPVDWEGLAVLRLQARIEGRALEALRRALDVEDEPAVRWRIAVRIARILRSAGRWEELLDLWEHEVGGRGAWRARALIETAKVCEHRLRQPTRALTALEEASAVTEWLMLTGEPQAGALDDEVRARLARLRHRMARPALAPETRQLQPSPAALSTNRAMAE
ncbi:MAG: ribonuclease H-like domain-containing protein [Armatimonadota bacterium]|nr:ribonuclease H-like domain-containing protein [Armatimonadota bacterium]